MLKIAICDDDSYFTSKLENLIIYESQKIGIRTETDVFSDGKNLLKAIQNGNHYPLIFIDIEMKVLDGITTARYIRESDRTVLLIYISGYEQYLKELFEVEPFRFLLKPLQKTQFSRYFADACQRIGETSDLYFHFTFNKEIKRIHIQDIVYFESRNRLIYIFLRDTTTEHFYGKLKDIEKSLFNSSLFFFRIHQSFLVNYNYIKSMNYAEITISYGDIEKKLKISEDRQKEIRQQLCEITSGKASI